MEKKIAKIYKILFYQIKIFKLCRSLTFLLIVLSGKFLLSFEVYLKLSQASTTELFSEYG